ncbi:apolipoprotein N-acyltransferase [Flavilitoribacter nigricans]|uniref:Apolipoprotein N-acyltransferase n=1 Tax=Flavilitoribacter nigricans (strain ATCC 23147 / DSM 23189 / NBRC 102662 / NCIMB 1420 / SS-2) TaxID=1122177 RepID=A0A2D0NGC1_FLAN2|nr:apolipoprotein N-acyltransferase [Flavilitoribacter nigricans]PHN07554.1 apolipoprotein N-acyltransferase [Flavilitoribacter nigricans DSM 23189 = NBRC 102662]
MPIARLIKKWTLPLSLILLAIALGIAFKLFSLTVEHRLWGYRPLFMYLFGWAGIVLFIAWNRERKGRIFHWQRVGLATLSGLILGLGFPGFIPFPWLLFIAFVPLLILEDAVDKARAAGEKVKLFPYAYHIFFIWNSIATFWVTNTALAAGLFAIAVNALLMWIPIWLFQQTKRTLPRFGLVAFIAYWLTFEYLHMHWDLSWPWLSLGNAFAQMYPTVQWYEYTGAFGGSLWILLMNVLLFRIWQLRQKGEAVAMVKWGQVAALVVLPIAISLALYYSYPETSADREVVVIQTNYEPHYEKFDGKSERDQIEEIIAMIKTQIDEQTDYVVLPETVFGYARKDELNRYPAVAQLRTGLQDYPGLVLISGLQALHILGADEPHTRATREEQDRNGQTYYLEIYNAAAQFTIGTEETQFYKKSKLVPGAEIFPFPWLFFFMKPVVDQLGGTTAGFGSQPERTPMISNKGRIAPVICYESIYGEYFAGYVRQGAQAAFIMTNDGWWDNTPGHRQHLYFASLRSIETRRSIARAANVGRSAFINERGDRVSSAKYDEAVALKDTISLNDSITFYVRWGDLIARIALFLSLLCLVGMIAARLKARVDKGNAEA